MSSKSDIRLKVYERVGSIAKAISSPPRLKLIQLLAQGPRTVEDLSEMSGESVANTSQHLQRLLKEKLVSCRKDGVSRIYKIENPHLLQLWEELQDLAHDVAPDLDAAEAELTANTIRSGIPVKEWLRRVKQERATLVDVRDPVESQATPVKRSVAIPLKDLAKRAGELRRELPVLILCRGRYCSMSTTAVSELRKKGFEAYGLRESSYKVNQMWGKV